MVGSTAPAEGEPAALRDTPVRPASTIADSGSTAIVVARCDRGRRVRLDVGRRSRSTSNGSSPTTPKTTAPATAAVVRPLRRAVRGAQPRRPAMPVPAGGPRRRRRRRSTAPGSGSQPACCRRRPSPWASRAGEHRDQLTDLPRRCDRPPRANASGRRRTARPTPSLCTASTTSLHCGQRLLMSSLPSVDNRVASDRRAATMVVSDGVGGRVEPLGERAARAIRLEHDDLLIDRPRRGQRDRCRRRAVTDHCDECHASLSPRRRRRLVATVGSVSTTRTSSAAATVGASAAATSTDSDCVPMAFVGRDRQRNHDRRRSPSGRRGSGQQPARPGSRVAPGPARGVRPAASLPSPRWRRRRCPGPTSGVACSDCEVSNEPDTIRTLAYCPTTVGRSAPATTLTDGSTSTSTVRSMSAVICDPAGTSTTACTAGSFASSVAVHQDVAADGERRQRDAGGDAVPPTADGANPRRWTVVGRSLRHRRHVTVTRSPWAEHATSAPPTSPGPKAIVRARVITPTVAVAPAASASAGMASCQSSAPTAAPSTSASFTSPKPIDGGDTRCRSSSGTRHQRSAPQPRPAGDDVDDPMLHDDAGADEQRATAAPRIQTSGSRRCCVSISTAGRRTAIVSRWRSESSPMTDAVDRQRRSPAATAEPGRRSTRIANCRPTVRHSVAVRGRTALRG